LNSTPGIPIVTAQSKIPLYIQFSLNDTASCDATAKQTIAFLKSANNESKSHFRLSRSFKVNMNPSEAGFSFNSMLETALERM